MPVVTQVGGLTGGAIKEQIFILVMYTFGVGTSDRFLQSCFFKKQRGLLDSSILDTFKKTVTMDNALDQKTESDMKLYVYCSVYCCGDLAMG